MGAFRAIFGAFHALSFVLVILLSLSALVAVGLAAFGVIPWLEFEARFGSYYIPEAGVFTQVGITLILVSLVFYVPSARRIMELEANHREFNLRMEDIARAYHVCHTADRSGVFTLSSEFDSVRERLAYLRDHPDLERLEPDVLEIAAQMSQQSRHLADVYNEDKVARAKRFLQQRQEEVERQQERIVDALHDVTEIRKWAQQVELEESVVASQLAQLEEQLSTALPALGFRLERDDTVITFADRPAAE